MRVIINGNGDRQLIIDLEFVQQRNLYKGVYTNSQRNRSSASYST